MNKRYLFIGAVTASVTALVPGVTVRWRAMHCPSGEELEMVCTVLRGDQGWNYARRWQVWELEATGWDHHRATTETLRGLER